MIAASKLPIWRTVFSSSEEGYDTEAHWVARAKQGDEAAYERLLKTYRHRAVRLAAHVMRRDSDAEDVAQEAYVAAFRSINKLSRDTSFSSWLFRIVVRQCIDRMRRASWSRETSDQVIRVQYCRHESTVETQVIVRRLLDMLSPATRAALVLREIEGLDYEQIAQVLDVPVGTVKSRLSAARQRFRELYLSATTEEIV